MPFLSRCLQYLTLSPSSGPTNSLVSSPHSLLSDLTKTPQCPDPYFLLVCLPPFDPTSSLDHMTILLSPLSPSPSTSVPLPHLPGIIITPGQPPQCAFSVLPLLQKTAPRDRLVSPIYGFQLHIHFVGFFMILSLISGELLLLFFSITVPIFTTFPNPAMDILSLHSWTFRTVLWFCYHTKKLRWATLYIFLSSLEIFVLNGKLLEGVSPTHCCHFISFTFYSPLNLQLSGLCPFHSLTLFFFFWLPHVACGILVSRPGIEPGPPVVEVWGLNHWTTREVPWHFF